MKKLIFIFISAAMISPTFGATIIRNFGGSSAPGTTTGSGNLVTIFNAAADFWEAAILDTHTLTINYDWTAIGGSTLGQHSLTGEGGSPHRETSASIVFDNDSSSTFFLDATPFDNSEYTTYTESTADYGGGDINNQRRWTGATGDAAGAIDLFTVALHEIGHALGMSSANDAFFAETTTEGDRELDITSGLYNGSIIPFSATSAHIDITTTLLYPSVSSNRRNLISAVDILANAGISQFTNLNFDPSFAAATPEPSTAVLFAFGSLLLSRVRKQHKLIS